MVEEEEVEIEVEEDVVVVGGGGDSSSGGGDSSGSRRRGGGSSRGGRRCRGHADRRLSPQDGRADVVANDAGDRVTPAVVAFTESEEVRPACAGPPGEPLRVGLADFSPCFTQVVGLAAKQSRIRNVSNTVVKVKQILGRR